MREAVIGDAEKYRDLRCTVLSESEFMLREPDEYRPDLGDVEREIERAGESDTDLVLVAESEGELVGFVTVRGSSLQRLRHSAVLLLAVRRSHWRRGIARRMLEDVISWVQASPLTRLELTVAMENVGAVRLYQEMGFEIEGTKRNAVRIGKRYFDDHVMSRLFT